MRLQAVDLNSNNPLAFTQIRLIIKDKDSGYIRVKTDGSGYFDLDNIYEGQKIGGTLTNVPGKWVTAKEGAILLIEFEAKSFHTSLITPRS